MSIVVIAEREFHDLYRSLSLKGERVEECIPREAHDCVKNCIADLILLDCGFDAAHGLQLLKEIKDLCPNIPIIFLADNRSSDSEVKALRAGAREFIEKPANIFELQKTIKNLLKIKRASKEKRASLILLRVDDIRGPMQEITTDKPACVIRAIRYIEDNFSKKISLNMIAKQANLSKYHFCRLFFRHTGMTPLQFTTFMRMQKAKELLEREDLTVSIIAVLVGFSDLGTFIRQFKKHTGMTPTAYKNSLKKS